jgi:hypothetical protein
MCQPLCAALPQRGDNSLEFPAASSYRRSRFTARPNTTWITAGIGVIILIASFVLMAYSAPGPTGVPARPGPGAESVHLPPGPGPVPLRELRLSVNDDAPPARNDPPHVTRPVTTVPRPSH